MTVSLTTDQNVDIAISILDEDGNLDPASFDAGSVVATLVPTTGATAVVSPDQTSVNVAATETGSYSLTVTGSVSGVPLTAGYESIVVTTPEAPVITATSIELTPGTPTTDVPVVAAPTFDTPSAGVANATTGEMITS